MKLPPIYPTLLSFYKENLVVKYSTVDVPDPLLGKVKISFQILLVFQNSHNLSSKEDIYGPNF
jgi:hypothetical protein